MGKWANLPAKKIDDIDKIDKCTGEMLSMSFSGKEMLVLTILTIFSGFLGLFLKSEKVKIVA
jgi:hypothetical protein